MKAIFKREVRSYFNSPVGYVCVAALMALYGFYYYQAMLMGSSSYIAQVFGTLFTFSMMIIPIITIITPPWQASPPSLTVWIFQTR